MCTVAAAINWGSILLAALIAGPAGFYVARAVHWWRGVKRGSRHLLPLVRYAVAGVIVLVLVGVVGLRATGVFG